MTRRVPTAIGRAALVSRPMTSAQVADLVERTRAADAAERARLLAALASYSDAARKGGGA